MAQLVFYSESRIQLAKEIQFHPDLLQALAESDANDFETKLAVIAAHVNIVLDDEYTQKDIDHICDLCWNRLRERRKEIILPLGH